MGKTPAKWIKSLLLGKKSSKSVLSKKEESLKSVKKGEELISSQVPVSNLTLDPSSISSPLNTLDFENLRVPQSSKNEVVQPSSEECTSQEKLNLSLQDNTARIRLEKAATRAQAAFRGYLARRAFRTLKGIIRLQALIRGYLVRRQAFATLYCVQGIVKVQALARGRIIRCSDIGIEVQKIQVSGAYVGANCLNSSQGCASSQIHSANAFVRKLLASPLSVMHLHLEYGPGEPNSVWEWLERWTSSEFWKPLAQSKGLEQESLTKHNSFQTVETKESKPKRRIRKQSSANVESGSGHSTLVSDRPKHTQRRVSRQGGSSVQAHLQDESEKVGHSLRKVPNQLKVGDEKPRHNLKNSSNPVVPSVLEWHNGDTLEKTKEKFAEQITTDDLVGRSHGDPALGVELTETSSKVECIQGREECSYKDDNSCNGSQKTSHRRTSLPANIDQQENGIHNRPKVPSYMVPTESARAKLRGQGSPRLAHDVADKNGKTRRHSLPSSASGKLSSPSLRAERLVQSSGKGAVKSDKSLTSSRDGGKLIQAEWRR